MADLVSAEEIAAFPGAPFEADVLTAAGEEVRGAARWHIAPSETHTVVLDSDGGTDLFLKSLLVTDVVAVRDVTGDTPVELTDVKWYADGTLYRRCGFPCGRQAVEVEFTHGYAACPSDLLPVVAAIARTSGSTSGAIRQKSLGSASVSLAGAWGGMSTGDVPAALARYTVPVI